MIAPTNRRIGKQKIPRETLASSPDFDPNDPEREIRDSYVPDEADVDAAARPTPVPAARESLKLARAMAIVRAAAGAALVVCVSSGVAWAARRYIMTSPRFGITEIVVNGGARRTQDDIAREAGLVIGENVFSVDLDDARARLIADPWIREAALARRLPGTLIVEVSEREAAAVVAMGAAGGVGGGGGGDTYLVSRDGDVIKRLEAGDPSDFPVITGITPDALTDDREGVTRTLRRALDLAGDYEHGPLARRAALQEIHVGVDGAITLVVGKSGLALVLGDPPFRRKLDQAARVMNELEKQGAKADAVMLDNEARPERVVVRMR